MTCYLKYIMKKEKKKRKENMTTSQELSDTKDAQKLIYSNILTCIKQATNVTAAKLHQNNA